MSKYLCEEGNCGMFENTELETCCMFCEIKDDCQGFCSKVTDFKDTEEVLNYCENIVEME